MELTDRLKSEYLPIAETNYLVLSRKEGHGFIALHQSQGDDRFAPISCLELYRNLVKDGKGWLFLCREKRRKIYRLLGLDEKILDIELKHIEQL